ncbi:MULTISPECIES: CDP-diacylglycerol--glycerol-3-phosphate 3-phosphatidyltransferase [unclassified Streptomyces]|uniref:CDP-diacylglycerol--glycerol-3-phosphate 3-phosphatidyltransferase n=1 Tax=unclassified Streptomyces TaxID=2593676 RepID=UPI0004C5515A|nr:CDP-diacylglycerol--glycerol-3-phosphate 3-phosphatidyltransferase [Streptomyces sp. NRRL F-5630]
MTGAPATATSGTGVPGGSSAAGAAGTPGVWNIANILTMIRLVLVPGFIALMLVAGGHDPAWRSVAWAAFTVAMITDLFDGHLARTYNLVTDFGKIADPIADKAIMGAALCCLSALGDLPWWVTGVILGRELGITLLRFVVIRYGVIPASRGGKLKTLAQGVAVGMYVLALTGWLASARFWVMAVAVALTVATGLDYVRQAIVLRREGIASRRAVVLDEEQARDLRTGDRLEAAVRGTVPREVATEDADGAAASGEVSRDGAVRDVTPRDGAVRGVVAEGAGAEGGTAREAAPGDAAARDAAARGRRSQA